MSCESSGISSCRSSKPAVAASDDLPLRYADHFVSFRDIAVFAFPGPKPEVALMELTGFSETSVRRWLRDECDPPGPVFALVLAEFLARYGRRRTAR